MAYVPPHRRQTTGDNSPSPTPFPFHPSQGQGSSKPEKKGNVIGGWVYAKDNINRWFVIPYSYSVNQDDASDGQLPCMVRMKEFSCEFLERRDGRKPMILVPIDHPQKDLREVVSKHAKSPWVSALEKMENDLLTSFRSARDKMCNDEPGANKPYVVIRFGKVLFHCTPSSVRLDSVDKRSAVESTLSRLNRTFFANIPVSFIERILGEVIQRIGVDLDEETEYYDVKVLDKYRPNITISCKCSIISDAVELDLYRVELGQMRHLVADMSCLDKNLDLRLMVSSKRIMTSLKDDERHSLNELLKLAVIDSEANGGLRWPKGKECVGNRYIAVASWRTKAKVFKNSFMMLKVRQVDRFDFKTSTAEVTHEANLKMTELTRCLRDTTLELNPLTDMVRDTLKLVWDHFLCCECEGSST